MEPALTRLLALLRDCPEVTGPTGIHQEPAALPATEAEWGEVIALAEAHKVAPLLAARWLGEVSPKLPSTVAARLRAIQTRTVQRSLLQFAELLRILEWFRPRSLPLLYFKGQMLAQQAYGSLHLRDCCDLDVFVRVEDVPRVKQELAALGYQPEVKLQPHEEEDLLRIECEYTFRREDGRVRIDLQWRPRARYFSVALPAEALWQRSATTLLQGREVPTFEVNDLLLLLVVHGGKHNWDKLELITALAGLIRRHPALDWPGIDAQARRCGAHRMLRLGLHLAVTHFQAPVPAPWAEAAGSDPAVIGLAADAARRWPCPGAPRPVLAELALHLRMKERTSDQLRHCFWMAVTPGIPDWQSRPFPAALHRLHYLTRPFRLLGKYVFRCPSNPPT